MCVCAILIKQQQVNVTTVWKSQSHYEESLDELTSNLSYMQGMRLVSQHFEIGSLPMEPKNFVFLGEMS
jgi:hypothetical protein